MFDKSLLAGVACAVAMACAEARTVTPPRTDADTAASAPHASHARPAARHVRPRLDRSGRTRVGQASFYAGKFDGRRMADGTRMDPQDDSAASKTLPLGTTARVTNLETGRSAVVTIRDRGPYVRGRIVDLSPATAEKLGMARHDGVSRVQVTPLAMPPPGGGDRTVPPATPQSRSRSTQR